MADSETTKTATASSKPLPPGMVLGPDGKPCKICTDSATWRALTKTVKKTDPKALPRSGSSSTSSSSIGSTAFGAGAAATLTDTEPERPADCPPDVEQLGRATWTFLHTTAAYYPEAPSPVQRSSMLSLLKSLPMLYPCSHCATHLRDNMKLNPPEKVVESRGLLGQWLCERHNDVNRRLGKEVFNCAKVDERWKDGPADGRCD